MKIADIKKYIKQKYKIESVSLWEDVPNYIVFRNNKKKWFAIIMDVPYNKVYRDSFNDKIIDIINVKLEPELVLNLKNAKGFAPAYHMNKKHWVSIEISKVNEKRIKNLIDMSFGMVVKQ